MTTIFKILLIILVAAPIIAFAVYNYLKMLAYIREKNNVEKARLARARVESGKEAKGRTEERKAEKRRKSSKSGKSKGDKGGSGKKKEKRK